MDQESIENKTTHCIIYISMIHFKNKVFRLLSTFKTFEVSTLYTLGLQMIKLLIFFFSHHSFNVVIPGSPGRAQFEGFSGSYLIRGYVLLKFGITPARGLVLHTRDLPLLQNRSLQRWFRWHQVDSAAPDKPHTHNISTFYKYGSANKKDLQTLRARPSRFMWKS